MIDYGKIAFEAAKKVTKEYDLSYPCNLSWEELTPMERNLWNVAAQAVIQEFTKD